MILIDESPWNTRVYNRHGRSKGTPCIVEAKTERTENPVATAGISILKEWNRRTLREDRTQLFQEFTLKLLSKLTEPTALAMDNGRLHHDVSVVDDIKGHGHCALFTATSSCELSPIERVFPEVCPVDVRGARPREKSARRLFCTRNNSCAPEPSANSPG